MSNKEEFLKLVSKEKTSTLKEIKDRIRNRAMLRESQQIALKVLFKLDELGWSQVDLAVKMKVKPQQVNRILRGKENLSLDTQVKLQEILDIPILASYYEKQFKVIENLILKFKDVRKYDDVKPVVANYGSGKIVKLQPNTFSNNCSYQA
jgi:transcriptional regulator with XRE-family HTH domain